LWLAAAERGAVLDNEGVVALLRRALAADPEFLPAVMEYREVVGYRDDLLAEYRRSVGTGTDPFLRCVAIVTGAPTGYPAAPVPELLTLERENQGSDCSAGYLGYLAVELTPARVWLVRGLEYLRRALEAAPAAPGLWERRAALFLFLGRAEEARATLLTGLAFAQHASHRVKLYQLMVSTLAASSDSARAPELQRALAAAVTRDGRPGILFLNPDYVRYLVPSTASLTAWERAGRERVRLATASRNWWLEWTARRSLGSSLTDAGRPAEALAQLDRAVRIADSVGAAMMQVEAYRFRGRAYAKLGRFGEAERDLRHAIAVGESIHDPYMLAEAWHNLAHVYEGMGRMPDAARAVDQFIELTQPLQHAQPRMMSLHDAGIIRWKAGWPAAANSAFEEMVRVVDQQERGHYWAGEHFEQIGDLTRALHYFQKGAELDRGERSLNLGGTARVFRALGQLDSAEVAARAHDSAMSNQLDVPMLPPILAAAGRTVEALEISRSWARKQIAQGNLQGAAMATNGLAELLLSSGDARQSLAEATRAQGLAQRVNLTDELIRARRLVGLDRLRLGDAGGLEILRQAAALAEAHPTAETTLLTRLALAESLAESGRTDEALNAFDGAARAVEQVAARLERDVDRARFRDHQLAPFDGAMELLLRKPATPDRLARLVSWSERRKAASLALAAGFQPASILSLDRLRQRLEPGSALVDYLTLRGKSAALVVTSERAELVPLPLSPDALRSLADRLRRPLVRAYAGRLDLARAPFDLEVAHRLYQAVLAPIEPLLTGVDHLFVVPDGPLHYVPFDALVSARPADPETAPAYSEARFAVDRFEIELLPSAQFLPEHASGGIREQLAVAGTRVLVIDRHAPGGTEEVAGIRSAWPSGVVKVLEGDEASETAVRAAIGGFTVLHFATHAEADDREPLASHLRLAGDETNDGFLHLGEIAAERRPAKLVVLSACETLSGRLYRGEGLMGLARAFLGGGAEAVVATQWPVGPESASLMAEFHRGLAAGRDPPSALRVARLALRRQPATAHPFFWAGFVLVRGARGPGFTTAAR